MNFVSEYIKYLYNAKGRHGIHSPFVYDFVDVCLRRKPDAGFLSEMKVLANTLAADRTLVETEDSGAGSRKLGKVRPVSAIFKTASSKGVYARLLWQLARHYKPARVLELGTSLGIGTAHLAAGDPGAEVFSVDACGNTLALAQSTLDRLAVGNVTLLHSTFDAFFAAAPREKFDLVYIDGHHDGKALQRYMSLLAPLTHDDTLFVLDDIRWSDGMLAAWRELSAREDFHLSMDLFRMGILARRSGQVKEHFTVRLKNVLSGF